MKFLSLLILSVSLVACGARSSDEEKVRALFDAVETAAEARDTSDVLDVVADDYSDTQGLDKTQLGHFLRGWFLAHPEVELLVTVDSLEFPADGIAQANVTVAQAVIGDANLERLRVELRRDGDDWKVVRADRRGR
jgi:hypothetical protein